MDIGVEGPAGKGDELPAGVLGELRELETPKVNWQQGLWVLALSLLAFSGGELRSMRWERVGAIVVTLFVHELGHLAAMRAFGYSDLRVFFLPFFGAAASGRKFAATGAQRAIVSLAGPLPSLALAVVLAVVTHGSDDKSFARELLYTMIGINAFNLIPFAPFDGGGFVDVAIFSRAPRLRFVFRIVGAVAVAVLALSLKAWLLCAVAVWMLLSSGVERATLRAVTRLRERLGALRPDSPAIPDELLGAVADAVRVEIQPRAGQPLAPRAFAVHMHNVWERAHQDAPTPVATALLLTIYLPLLAAIVAIVLRTSGHAGA